MSKVARPAPARSQASHVRVALRYLGEWKEETGQAIATSEEKREHAHTCFVVAGIYAAFFVVSVAALCVFRARS